jgi:hypothetical protein
MITPEELSNWIDDLYSDYAREEDQAILQRDMDKAVRALAGKEACQRIRQRIEARTQLPLNVARMPRGRR